MYNFTPDTLFVKSFGGKFEKFDKNLLKGGETCRSGHFLANTLWC